MIKASIITIGDELLYGQVVDTNSSWIGKKLAENGIVLRKKISIGDEKELILSTLKEGLEDVDILLITGGLGPTKDDITKKTIAEFLNVALVFKEEIWLHVKGLFEKRGRVPHDINKLQADVPEGTHVLFNQLGTAPGMWMEYGAKVIVSMPGVPHEMKYIMNNGVLPKVKESFLNDHKIEHKFIKTFGCPESDLSVLLDEFENSLPINVGLAYLPGYGQVKLRLTVSGRNEEEIHELFNVYYPQLVTLTKEYAYAYHDEPLEMSIGKFLKQGGFTIATAESCSGGSIAKGFTSNSGSSGYFKGSIVAYDNEVKSNVLGVSPTDIETYGAVSETVAQQMAEGVKGLLKTDFAISTTGVAGPTGGTVEKPVGTVWVAVSTPKTTITRLLNFSGDRETNIALTQQGVLNLLLGELLNNFEVSKEQVLLP